MCIFLRCIFNHSLHSYIQQTTKSMHIPGLKLGCPKISSTRSLHKGSVLYPAKNEEIYGTVHVLYQKFSCHVTLATFKKENFKMCVTSGSYVGHIWIVLWVSGSNSSTGVTHFQPWHIPYSTFLSWT